MKCKDCGHGKPAPLHHPDIILPGADNLLDQEGKVVYTSRACPGPRSGNDGTNRIFPAPVSSTGQALEWLAVMCSHSPNRGEQPVILRHYDYYSNVSRGKRQMAGSDGLLTCILEPQGDEKAFRRDWALLIPKIYEVDPLICPKCQGTMRGISSIEDPAVILEILNHLRLWNVP